ncbi:MAG: RNA polymerase sigma factor [Planctomycetota bacterium]|jgi:RNA polymerase sigma-70 factor (ECF subfamily)
MDEPYRQLSDEELLLRCKHGTPAEARMYIDVIVSRYEAQLVNYLYRMLGDRGSAEDLFQETFIRIFRKVRDYKTIARFTTWMYTIATNLALNEIRDRKKRPRIILDRPANETEAEHGLGSTIPSDTETPDKTVQRRDIGRLVQKAVARIPEVYRAVLILCDLEGLSYQEAAAVLDVNIGTIRSRLARARENFARIFEPFLSQLEDK